MSKRGSLTSAKSLHELKHETEPQIKRKDEIEDGKSSHVEEPTCTKGIRPSKSETSITDSFVVIDNEYNKRKNHCHLREGNSIKKKIIKLIAYYNNDDKNIKGFKWKRQLMFRSKLTMHTAYDRKDNAEPASITSLAVSKDHKTLFVGDARGRVFSWSVAEQPGRGIADHWLKDEGADQCVGCHVR